MQILDLMPVTCFKHVGTGPTKGWESYVVLKENAVGKILTFEQVDRQPLTGYDRYIVEGQKDKNE